MLASALMQDQLLHAPVEQLGDVEQVLGRAGDFVDPAKLLELFSRLAEYAEHLALKAELVDPPRVGVGCEQHLVGPRRDAQRPGRTRRHGQRAARGFELDEVGPVADRRTRRRIVRHIDPYLAQERAVAIEDLDAAIAAVGYIDVAPGIRGDAMRRMKLAGLAAAVAPRLEPVAAAVDLRDAGVDVAVADVGVAGGIPGDVGDLAEAAVLGRPRRAGVLQRPGFFIGGFLLAADQHRHPPPRIELHHHVRALVRDSDVVAAVDAHRVAERPGVQVPADLAHELAVAVELQQLRRRRRVGRPGRVAARENEHVALGIHRHAGHLAEMQVAWQFERIRNGVELNDLRVSRRIEKYKDCEQRNSQDIHCVTSVVAGAPVSLTMKISALAVTLALGFLDTTWMSCAAPPAGSDAMSTIATNAWLLFIR